MAVTVCFLRVLHLIVYIIACSSDRHAPIQIAFGIMVYQRPKQDVSVTIADFSRLMSRIYEDELNHVYVLHIDYKSDPLLHKHLNEYCTSRSNCISIDSRSVTWGGISVTEMNLALMQAADDYLYPDGRSSSWEYFVLVGHESTPLTTLKYTENFLMSYPKGTNFINCWRAGGYNFFGQWENVIHRLSRIVVDSPGDNVLHETGLAREVPNGIKVYKSLQYVVLSREFVRFACHGPGTRQVLLFLANVKASDELLLSTLLHLNVTLAATATCDTTLHFTHWIRPGGSWHPEYLNLEHLPMLLNSSSHLFVRKTNGIYSADLLKALDRIRLDYFDNYPENQFVDAKLNVCENHPDTMECSLSGASIIPKDLSGEIDGNDDDKEDIYVDDDDDDDMHGVQPYYKMTPLLQRRDLIDREFRWLIPLGVKYLQELWEDESTDSSIIEAILDHALEVSEMDSLRSSINIQSTDSSYVDIPEDHEDIIESHTSSTKTITDDCNDLSNTCNSNKEYKKLHPMEENIDVNSNSNFYSSPYDLLMTLDVARRARDRIETEKYLTYLKEYAEYEEQKQQAGINHQS